MATKKLSLNELKKLVRKIVKEQMDIELDPVLISQFMLDNETSWQDSEDNVKGMNEWLMNVPTKNGMTLSDYY